MVDLDKYSNVKVSFKEKNPKIFQVFSKFIKQENFLIKL